MSLKGFVWRALLTLFLLVLLYQLWIFIHICWWVDHNPSRSAFMNTTLAEMQAIDPDATLNHRWVDYKRISPNLKRALIEQIGASPEEHRRIADILRRAAAEIRGRKASS